MSKQAAFNFPLDMYHDINATAMVPTTKFGIIKHHTHKIK